MDLSYFLLQLLVAGRSIYPYLFFITDFIDKVVTTKFCSLLCYLKYKPKPVPGEGT